MQPTRTPPEDEMRRLAERQALYRWLGDADAQRCEELAIADFQEAAQRRRELGGAQREQEEARFKEEARRRLKEEVLQEKARRRGENKARKKEARQKWKRLKEEARQEKNA